MENISVNYKRLGFVCLDKRSFYGTNRIIIAPFDFQIPDIHVVIIEFFTIPESMGY